MKKYLFLVSLSMILFFAASAFAQVSSVSLPSRSDINIEVQGDGSSSIEVHSQQKSSESSTYNSSHQTTITDNNGTKTESTHVEKNVVNNSSSDFPQNVNLLGVKKTNNKISLGSRDGSVTVTLSGNLKGRVLIQVEGKGEAWYVDPDSSERVYLGRPDDAFKIMREHGIGISNSDLAKISKSNENINRNNLAKRLSGQILIQVQNRGEAWYVDPVTLKRYYLGKPNDAFNIMRELSLGIKNSDLAKIKVEK